MNLAKGKKKKIKKVRNAENEAVFRDQLSVSLNKLESDLEFLSKEEYIPNKIGTRSFVDILARDPSGKYVLIEVKRTRVATRDTLHELLKYVEGAKNHLGLREDELRLIVVAVDWKELIVPFSSLVSRISCDVIGYQASVGKSNWELVKQIDPIKLGSGRLIARWHELHFYLDKRSRDRGLRDYKRICKESNIASYVIVELQPPEGMARFPSTKQISMRGMMGALSGTSEVPESPEYEFILYFGMQQLAEDEYEEIIRQHFPKEFNEIKAFAEAEGEDTLSELHQAVARLRTKVHSDFREIGYPAKFHGRLLEEEGWRVREIHRFGSFSRNNFLTDGELLAELSGEQGVTQQRFVKVFCPTNKAEVAEVRTGVNGCLEDCPAWRLQIGRVLDEVLREHPKETVRVSIFNPSAALLTIYLAATHDNGPLYVPMYNVVVNPDDPKLLYYGALVTGGEPKSLKDIVEEFFEGKTAFLLWPLQWGGYEARDTEILKSAGLLYRSFKVYVLNEMDRQYYKMTDEGWDKTEKVDPLTSFYSHLRAYDNFTQEIVDFYGSRWDGSAVDLSEQPQ